MEIGYYIIYSSIRYEKILTKHVNISIMYSLFNNYFWKPIYYMPGTVPDTGNTAVNKTKNLPSWN